MIVYGIEYSEQAREKPQLVSSVATYEGVNKGKGSTIKLIDEIARTNDEERGGLGRLTNDFCKEIEQKAQTLVPPKQKRKIM